MIRVIAVSQNDLSMSKCDLRYATMIQGLVLLHKKQGKFNAACQ